MEVAYCFLCYDNTFVDFTCHMCVSTFLVPWFDLSVCFLHGFFKKIFRQFLHLNVLQSVISYAVKGYQMIKRSL